MNKNLNEVKELLKNGVSSADVGYLSAVSDENILLNQINKILSCARVFAIDDETNFHGASIIKTSDNRFYLGVNLQTGEDIERQCSERNAINKALEDDRNTVISDIWFMGAVGFKKPDLRPIEKGREGERNCPCGSCLQIIYQYKDAQNHSNIHVLPANDGDMEIVYGQKNKSDSNVFHINEVMSKSVESFIPFINIRVDDPDGVLSAKIFDVFEDLQSHNEVVNTSRIDKIQVLDDLRSIYKTDQNVFSIKLNSFMVNELRIECSREINNIRAAEVVVVRRSDGELFYGSNLFSRVQSSTPSAVFVAISNAIAGHHNPKITDVWKMRMNFENIEENLKQFERQKYIIWRSFTGDERERIKKFSVQNSENTPNASTHIILPNNGNILKNELVSVITMSIMTLLPSGFRNPKQEI